METTQYLPAGALTGLDFTAEVPADYDVIFGELDAQGHLITPIAISEAPAAEVVLGGDGKPVDLSDYATTQALAAAVDNLHNDDLTQQQRIADLVTALAPLQADPVTKTYVDQLLAAIHSIDADQATAIQQLQALLAKDDNLLQGILTTLAQHTQQIADLQSGKQQAVRGSAEYSLDAGRSKTLSVDDLNKFITVYFQDGCTIKLPAVPASVVGALFKIRFISRSGSSINAKINLESTIQGYVISRNTIISGSYLEVGYAAGVETITNLSLGVPYPQDTIVDDDLGLNYNGDIDISTNPNLGYNTYKISRNSRFILAGSDATSLQYLPVGSRLRFIVDGDYTITFRALSDAKVILQNGTTVSSTADAVLPFKNGTEIIFKRQKAAQWGVTWGYAVDNTAQITALLRNKQPYYINGGAVTFGANNQSIDLPINYYNKYITVNYQDGSILTTPVVTANEIPCVFKLITNRNAAGSAAGKLTIKSGSTGKTLQIAPDKSYIEIAYFSAGGGVIAETVINAALGPEPASASTGIDYANPVTLTAAATLEANKAYYVTGAGYALALPDATASNGAAIFVQIAPDASGLYPIAGGNLSPYAGETMIFRSTKGVWKKTGGDLAAIVVRLETTLAQQDAVTVNDYYDVPLSVAVAAPAALPAAVGAQAIVVQRAGRASVNAAVTLKNATAGGLYFVGIKVTSASGAVSRPAQVIGAVGGGLVQVIVPLTQAFAAGDVITLYTYAQGNGANLRGQYAGSQCSLTFTEIV